MMDNMALVNVVLNVLALLLFFGLYFEMRKIAHIVDLMTTIVTNIPEAMSKQRFNVDARQEVTAVEAARAETDAARAETDAVRAETDAARSETTAVLQKDRDGGA